MERTIIYIFGPKRLQDDYQNGKCLPQDTTGWLKIGQTTTSTDEDKWNIAMARIKMISRTGVCEPSQLLDVFEYPKTTKHLDDIIRNELTSGVYNLDCSRRHNELVKEQEYEIKAGREFVYGASRSQIFSAIAKIERDLILRAKSEQLDELLKYIRLNNNAIEEEEKMASDDLCFYDEILTQLSSRKIDGNHPESRNYATIKSNISSPKLCLYSIKYSFKRNTAMIDFESMNGESALKLLEQKISQNPPTIALNNPLQGTKNHKKYFWRYSKSFNSFNKDEVVKWFVENVVEIYNYFENLK